jgi:ElaB/YqjD/DUF883 family membrane-anchored ribosome-binding protein
MALNRKISNTAELQEAIRDLEQKVKFQEAEMKQTFSDTKENLRPQRVLKNTFSYLAETPEVQKIMVNTVIGFILGYASRKAAELLREDVLDQTIRNVVTNQLTAIERKGPESVLSKAVSLFRKHTPQDSPIYPFVGYK